MDMGNALATTLSTDVYPEALLPIEEVYCYLPNTGYVLSPNYFISAERYYSWMKRYANSEYENWLKALSEESNYYQFLPMDNVAPNFSKNYYMYMVNMDDLYYMDANAVVCFVLEKEELSSLFTTLSSDNFDTDFIVAVNEDNVPFMSLLLILIFLWTGFSICIILIIFHMYAVLLQLADIHLSLQAIPILQLPCL